VALDDSYSTDEDTLLTVVAPGVLSNDTDPESNPLTASLVTDVSNGTLALNGDGSFTYDPDANFNGSDSFTYKANDGTADSNIATVTITVNPVNDPPVALDDDYTVAEDSPLSVPQPGVLQNDYDVDLDPLSVNLDTTTSHGTLSLNSNGSFIYIPNNNFNGQDTFTYYLNDGTTNSELATVTITVTPVNDAPKAYNESYNTLEDTLLTVAAPGVLENDTDVDEDILTAVLATTTLHGTLTLNANGGFTYLPELNYAGTDSFTYRVSDGTVTSNLATTTITITAVNDAPVGIADSYSVLEDNTLTVTAPGILTNDTDVENDPLTAVLQQTVSHGVLSLNPNGGFTYTPTANYYGSDSFSYRAYDGDKYSGITTVTITVQPVNDPPVAQADSYTASIGSVLYIDAPGVLDNDSDIDNNPLIARLLTPPSRGELTLNSDGSFSYATDPNSFETVSFTYEAYDGQLASNSATVTIQIIAGAVLGVNWLQPVGNSQAFTSEDQWLELEAEVINCGGTCSVRFFRWDPTVSSFVDIFVDNTAPYQATIHPKQLSAGWNEFDVVAFDNEGNASQRRYIFVWRDYWTFMPMPIP
jgi:VCBS repeat-containing protein